MDEVAAGIQIENVAHLDTDPVRRQLTDLLKTERSKAEPDEHRIDQLEAVRSLSVWRDRYPDLSKAPPELGLTHTDLQEYSEAYGLLKSARMVEDPDTFNDRLNKFIDKYGQIALEVDRYKLMTESPMNNVIKDLGIEIMRRRADREKIVSNAKLSSGHFVADMHEVSKKDAEIEQFEATSSVMSMYLSEHFGVVDQKKFNHSKKKEWVAAANEFVSKYTTEHDDKKRSELITGFVNANGETAVDINRAMAMSSSLSGQTTKGKLN